MTKSPKHTTTLSLALVAALGLALPAAPALAEKHSVSVEYSDLNLGTPEGQAALDRRILKAAERVCDANRAKTGTRLENREARECVTMAAKQVRSQIAAAIDESRLGG